MDSGLDKRLIHWKICYNVLCQKQSCADFSFENL